MKNNKLCERVEGSKLHIYVNSDRFYKEKYNLSTSYDEENLAYAINLSEENGIEKGLDEFFTVVTSANFASCSVVNIDTFEVYAGYTHFEILHGIIEVYICP